MLSSIVRAWQLQPETAHWCAGSVHGNVELTSGGNEKRLTVQVDLGPQVRIEVGALHYQAPGQEKKSVFAGGKEGLIQEPYLVLPRVLETEVGLRLVPQVLAESDAVTMDFRMETIACLEQLSLDLVVTLEGAVLRALPAPWPRTGDGLTRREFHWLDIVVNDEVVGALLTDLGEGGHGRLDSTGQRAEISLFEQPLEKGVILVGRWGIVRRLPGEDSEEFRRRHSTWLARRTFL